jgi:hypothetical protein
VPARLAGDVHWKTLTTVDGTSHLTLPSPTEIFISGDPAGMFDIDGGVLRWTETGCEPLQVSSPWPRTKSRCVLLRGASRQRRSPAVGLPCSGGVHAVCNSVWLETICRCRDCKKIEQGSGPCSEIVSTL